MFEEDRKKKNGFRDMVFNRVGMLHRNTALTSLLRPKMDVSGAAK